MDSRRRARLARRAATRPTGRAARIALWPITANDVEVLTLELYRQLGIADEVVAAGWRTPAINLWVRGERAAHVAMAGMGEGQTPYPFEHSAVRELLGIGLPGGTYAQRCLPTVGA